MPALDWSESQWQDGDYRYVAFVDVLGFSELVMKTAHGLLLNIYSGTLQMAADYGLSGGAMRADGAGQAIPDTDLATVNMRIVSDSVLLWTDNDTSPEFVALVMAVSRLLGAGIATGTHFGLRSPGGKLTTSASPTRHLAWVESRWLAGPSSRPTRRRDVNNGPAATSARALWITGNERAVTVHLCRSKCRMLCGCTCMTCR